SVANTPSPPVSSASTAFIRRRGGGSRPTPPSATAPRAAASFAPRTESISPSSRAIERLESASTWTAGASPSTCPCRVRPSPPLRPRSAPSSATSASPTSSPTPPPRRADLASPAQGSLAAGGGSTSVSIPSGWGGWRVGAGHLHRAGDLLGALDRVGGAHRTSLGDLLQGGDAALVEDRRAVDDADLDLPLVLPVADPDGPRLGVHLDHLAPHLVDPQGSTLHDQLLVHAVALRGADGASGRQRRDEKPWPEGPNQSVSHSSPLCKDAPAPVGAPRETGSGHRFRVRVGDSRKGLS